MQRVELPIYLLYKAARHLDIPQIKPEGIYDNQTISVRPAVWARARRCVFRVGPFAGEQARIQIQKKERRLFCLRKQLVC